MAEILLIMPPYLDIYGKIDIKKIGFLRPSLGIAYIASFLKSHGKDIELIDANFIIKNNLKSLFKKIKEERPKIVGFTVVTASMLTVVKMADEIKRISPESMIVVGGLHPSALPVETIQYKAIDIVVIGEGELTMLDLCEGKDLSGIKGICYKDAKGAVRINEPRPLIEELDSLPFPLLEHLPIAKYGYLSLGNNALPVVSTRGCPYNCSFCASCVINQRRCRFRSPTNFVDEIEYWFRKFNINKFVFCDDSFTFDKKRTIEICEEIINRNLNIRWSCMMRVDNNNEELLRKMKDAKCQMIEIGVESADEYILEKSNKRIKLSQVVETVKLANKVGLEINAFFILGLPFETRQSIERTINFSKKLKIDYAQFSMFIPLPGSQAWELAKKGNDLRCIASDWSEFARYKKAIVTSNYLSNETLLLLHKKAIRDFYLRPSIILRTLKKIDSLKRLKNLWNEGLCVLNISRDR